MVIPEKVTAVWAHNEAGMPADHRGRLQRLLPSMERIEGTDVRLDLKFTEDDDGQFIIARMLSCLEIFRPFYSRAAQLLPGTPVGDQTR